ncbi:MAG: hypothetical protein EON60_09510 [Alphaproteobacteria bacterium]|nr:MAG: hypothetical protein EON60_09510 [Alphaproteobacteria bacterium]
MGIGKRICVMIAVLMAAGCANKPEGLQSVIDRTVVPAHVWQSGATEVDGWTLAIARKGMGHPVRIYIEGDGHAYVNRTTPSGDPTPYNPVGLKLALKDTHDNVLYIARPCQWEQGTQCRDIRGLWTQKRFITPVIDQYAVLIMRETEGRPVELVGFSGGAWIALQVAARLQNVTKVVTVAGNLAPDWVNTQHRVSPMPVEPYPQGRLAELPVEAYIGTMDKVVTAGVVDAYREQTGARNVKVIEHYATHTKGWEMLAF